MTKDAAPDVDVWWSGLRWTDGAYMQLRRLEEAFQEWEVALADAQHRHQLNDDSDHSREWRDGYDQGYELYDPARPLKVPSVSLHMQVANEADLLMVAIRNVLRAQVRIPSALRPEMTGENALKLLRNVGEHYDERKGCSESRLASEHPDFAPGVISYQGKDIWLGGPKGIPLTRIIAWLARVRQALKTALAEAGVEMSDDDASMMQGDDELPWPPERLHYHWSIPKVEEQDWPRGTTPPDVADALAMIFARRRARDPYD